MKRFLVFCLLCVSVCAGNAQPRFGTIPQGAPPVPAPRPAFVPPPVPAPSFGSGGWNSPPQVAAPVQNWVAPPRSVPPQISAPVFGGQPQWNAPVALPQPFGQAQQVNQPPAIAAPVITAPTAQAPTQRPTLQSPTAQGVQPPAVAPSLTQPTPRNDTTVPRAEAPVQVQGAAPILSSPAVPRAPPQNAGTGVTTKNSSALATAVPQEALVGRTPASSRFIAPPAGANADPQSTSALALGFLKELPTQTKNALAGTAEGVYEGLTNTAKAIQKLPGQFVDVQVAGYSPSTYQKAAAEVKAFSTDPSVRQYYANAATTAAQNLVSGTTAAAERWFQSTDAREPSKAIASATTQAVIGEVAAGKGVSAATKYLNGERVGEVATDALTGKNQIPRNGSRVVIQQENGPTCGPTACAMVLNTMGKNISLSEIMSQVKMTPTGTDFSNLKQLLQENGVNVRGNPSTTIDDIKYGTRNGKPAIVDIKLPGGHHAVVVDGITTRNGVDVVAVRDPWGIQYFEPVATFEKKIGFGAIFIRQ